MSTDIAAENYYARRDGTNATEDLPVADEAESWTFTVIGQAGLYGVPTATDLAVCVCKNRTHREISRVPVKTDDEAATQMSLDAARGLDPHTIARTNLALQTEWEIVP